MKNITDFYLIHLEENYWCENGDGLILLDDNNVILNHNIYNYFLKLNSILERKHL